MTTRRHLLPDAVQAYLQNVGTREHPVLQALREETSFHPWAHYQIGPEGGQLLTFLAEVVGAGRALDIGTFTGYSALTLALAMGPNGLVTTIDVDPGFHESAHRFWLDADVADRIEAIAGPAQEVLERLIAEDDRTGAYDLALVDADKEGYPVYYEQALTLVRGGGVIIVDNTLWRGRVADPDDHRARTAAIRDLNTLIHRDERVTPVILPLGDGMTLARKRP